MSVPGVISFTASDCLPESSAVLACQGVPDRAVVPPKVHDLTEAAFELFDSLVEAVGIEKEVSAAAFARIYRGEGLNAATTPIEAVLEQSRQLVLFAATVGAPVCREISRLFAGNDPALGCMLDAVASCAAERLATTMAQRLEARLTERRGASPALRVLAYSPGYCGWHVSGQRRLLAALDPARIGITLNPSFLMQPLKSVSGVLVAAPAEAHHIEPGYDFCSECATQSCLERAATVSQSPRGG